jgi:protein-tyrosine phosphatase
LDRRRLAGTIGNHAASAQRRVAGRRNHAWKQAGIEVIVSLLDDEETEELGLAEESEIVSRAGMEFIAFPVQDRGIPESRRAIQTLLRRLESDLAGGRRVAVHCRAGIGRSAMIAAALLTLGGVDSDTAFKGIAAARGCPVPDTAEQRTWVERFHQENAAPTR